MGAGQKNGSAGTATSFVYGLTDPVFDESTSALDPKIAAKIHDIIHTIKPLRILIIIAHKLSAIQNCDRISVFHQGEVVEQGFHDHLLRQQGFYRGFIAAYHRAQTTA